MTPEQIEARFQRIEAILIASAEAHTREMSELRASQAKTEAIANSNARAIEAVANQQMASRQLQDDRYQQTQAQLTEFIRTVAQFVSSTETRLQRLENQ